MPQDRSPNLPARSFLPIVLLAGCLGWHVGAGEISAATPVKARAKNSWQVLETANFRIMLYGTQAVSPQWGEQCEAARTALCEKWLGETLAGWSPKCDVVLHPNDASYLKEVGAGAGNTIASSLVDQRRGQLVRRRIDVRSAATDWLSAALPHELTHVVLADGFEGQNLPRWVDEGLAILADPRDKQRSHRDELLAAIDHRDTFRVGELLALDDYPAAHRWGTFYGQSASLVEYLVAQRSPADFVSFVRLSFERGYDGALQDVYGLRGVAELERRWSAEARDSREGLARQQGRRPAGSKLVANPASARDRIVRSER